MLKTDLKLPAWFVKGRTVLIPKPGCVGKPDQYRPITCLNTGYKFFTVVFTTLLRCPIDKHPIFPAEQRALRKDRCGFLNALMFDSMVNGQVHHRWKRLSVAWVNYSKVFNSVPHGWLLEVPDLIRAPVYLRRCVANPLPLWATQFRMGFGQNAMKVDLHYCHGLFQGDSLSPLIFCLSTITRVNPSVAM